MESTVSMPARVLISSRSLANSGWKIALVCGLGSLQFYLITNFGHWLTTDMYPHTLEGVAFNDFTLVNATKGDSDG